MAAEADDAEQPARLRRAEAVVRARTSHFVVVLDGLCDSFNVSAIMRTCEALGVQHLWEVDPAPGSYASKNLQFAKQVHKGAAPWLTRRKFATPVECIAAAREAGLRLWATDLSREAVLLDAEHCPRELVAERPLAIVIGRENLGVRDEFLEAADRRVYLRMSGFTESFNVSVATALVLQRLFDIFPGARGRMDAGERDALRRAWAERLSRKSDAARAEFVRIIDSGTPIAPADDLRPPAENRVAHVAKRERRRLGAERAAAKMKEEQDAKRARLAARAAAAASSSSSGQAPQGEEEG